MSTRHRPPWMRDAGSMMLGVADWLDEHAGADFDTLAAGPLGESQTTSDLRELAGDEAAQRELAAGIRRSVAAVEHAPDPTPTTAQQGGADA